MANKQKIYLSREKETLLITLYCRVIDNLQPKPLLKDPYAQQILNRIEYGFEQLKVPHGTQITMVIRAKQFDKYTQQFIVKHPNAIVMHLGCGLDSRYFRIKDAGIDLEQVSWYDLDLPEVIELRRKMYPEADGYELIASSAEDLSWIQKVHESERPALMIAEGLSMYLHPQDIKSLFQSLKDSFPKCHIILDAYSTMTMRNANRHPSVRRTGASFHWGIDDPYEVETWMPGIKLREEWYFNQSEAIPSLSPSDRFIFALTGLFPFIRNAHRILYFQCI
jgi:O-methyltransferase involved in polyketide biosynthesis